jgi:hypothetical protein
VILRPDAIQQGTVTSGELIQAPMQPFRLPLVDQLLSLGPVGGLYESIVQQLIRNSVALQLSCQPVVAVAIEL